MTTAEATQIAVWAGLAALWAGVALAGNLIVAPAKFQVQTLDLPLALQVGRAQFTWVGYAEWCLLVLILAALLLSLRIPPVLLLIPIIIFLAQQLWLQPILRTRSDIIIAGGAAPESKLHFIFAALETVKVGSLILSAALGLLRLIELAR